MNLQGNRGPPQEVYIIKLDPNLQISSQAVPLHLMENSGLRLAPEETSRGLVLPLMQQRQATAQPMLFIEPVEESTKVINKIKNLPKTVLNNEISSPIPLDLVQNVNGKTNLYQNQILNRTIIENKPLENDYSAETDIKKTQIKLKQYVHISDTKAPPRAIAVLPAVLQIRGKWISPRRTLSARVRFGPVQGIHKTITKSEAKLLVSNSTTPVFLLSQNKDHVTYIDVTDKDKSNWLGLLPFGEISSPPSSANVWLYEDGNELYGLTVHPIGVRRPLRLGYSKKYAEEHGVPPGKPLLDLETVIPVQWWCQDCNRAMPSAGFLQRHSKIYHRDETKVCRPCYRCKYCRRTFCRLYTMKRHILTNCPKRVQRPLELNQQTIEPNPEPDISSTLEENRIPSDESFQNFTNSLDFSTNLFDTDRMAGLDIAGSRADNEFNPYSIGFRDDNGLSNDLGFTKLSNASESLQSNEIYQQKKSILYTCTYCDQVVVNEDKNKHLRQCPSRLICECGRVFRHKTSLAQHIDKFHSNAKMLIATTDISTTENETSATETSQYIEIPEEDNEQDKPEKEKELAYKCQECQLGFKRRGMLVNHLWRIHKMISTSPVEKKVRHYPCIVCPKIYRSSTKRDIHVRAHHPGIEKVRGHSIEGGVKSCQPASCTECPRQYVTRAKLLQHVRANHPHLANVMKIQAMKNQTKPKTESETAVVTVVAKDIERSAASQMQLDFYYSVNLEVDPKDV